MSRYGLTSVMLAAVLAGLTFAGPARGDTPGKWAIRAVSDDGQAAQEAIDHLRAMGPDGLEAMFAAHRSIIDNLVSMDLEGLNGWVYAELFLTPAGDPWLGLAPENTYTALENTTTTR